jgi:hypothetical protein
MRVALAGFFCGVAMPLATFAQAASASVKYQATIANVK